MARKPRNYAKEQENRLKLMNLGYSRTQAYGHPKKGKELSVTEIRQLIKEVDESPAFLDVHVNTSPLVRDQILQDLQGPFWENIDMARNYISLLKQRRYVVSKNQYARRNAIPRNLKSPRFNFSNTPNPLKDNKGKLQDKTPINYEEWQALVNDSYAQKRATAEKRIMGWYH